MRDEFRRELLRIAAATVGVVELSHNSGPEIDDWLAYAHAKPGDPWCASWVATMHHYAANAVNSINPCPRSATVITMWDLTLPECRRPVPYPGCVYFLDHGGHTGHAGIIETVSPGGTVMSEVSGNTNGAGSREGDRVARHHGPPELSHGGKLLGFADYSELLPL